MPSAPRVQLLATMQPHCLCGFAPLGHLLQSCRRWLLSPPLAFAVAQSWISAVPPLGKAPGFSRFAGWGALPQGSMSSKSTQRVFCRQLRIGSPSPLQAPPLPPLNHPLEQGWVEFLRRCVQVPRGQPGPAPPPDRGMILPLQTLAYARPFQKDRGVVGPASQPGDSGFLWDSSH